MKIKAQVGMVMNLDKCIGCHTCSVTCKQAWTNRDGVEYAWFNNVETRPGLGYPRTYQDQDKWKGGWELTRGGKLKLRQGGRLKRLATIFNNPTLPGVDDYYEPWTYDYDTLLNAPAGEHSPVAQPESAITGKRMQIKWSANWDDNLAGTVETGHDDPVVKKIKGEVGDRILFEYEQAFMFYLPRICEHCINPSCVASCPSGAMYKREEDGIVLVDQDACRGWRQCITGCPYKKVFFNHATGKAEKCTMCYPRIEAGEPTICSETCVGRLRYLGIIFYDEEKVTAAAATPDPQDLYEAQLDLILDPHDPEVQAAARAEGIAEDWIEAAKKSPIYRLAKDYRVALPLHPEYRTMPMVWYIPPLSPVSDALKETGHDAEDADNLFGALRTLRIPIEYLAELFTAGDVAPVLRSLDTLAAMRSYMRDANLGNATRPELAERVGLTEETMLELYRLLAIANPEDRYVIPAAHNEIAKELDDLECALDAVGGPGGDGPPRVATVDAESFHTLKGVRKEREYASATSGDVNLPHWDGKGVPLGMPTLRVRSDD